MPTIELTTAQIAELKDVLFWEIDSLGHMVDGSSHPDDIADQQRKAGLQDILRILEASDAND